MALIFREATNISVAEVNTTQENTKRENFEKGVSSYIVHLWSSFSDLLSLVCRLVERLVTQLLFNHWLAVYAVASGRHGFVGRSLIKRYLTVACTAG